MLKKSWIVRIFIFLIFLIIIYFGLILLGKKLVQAPVYNKDFKGPTGEPFVKGPPGPPPGY